MLLWPMPSEYHSGNQTIAIDSIHLRFHSNIESEDLHNAIIRYLFLFLMSVDLSQPFFRIVFCLLLKLLSRMLTLTLLKSMSTLLYLFILGISFRPPRMRVTLFQFLPMVQQFKLRPIISMELIMP